jgi:hypothetical protein
MPLARNSWKTMPLVTTEGHSEKLTKPPKVVENVGGCRRHSIQSSLVVHLQALRQQFENLGIVRQKQEVDEIDSGIAALISVMNESGMIRTIASCEGHPKKLFPPYVYFSASIATAARIEDALRNARKGSNNRLTVKWEITGHFDDKYRLRFCLYAPKYDRCAHFFPAAWVQFWLKRNQVRQDLGRLTELMKYVTLDPRKKT